MVLREKAGGQCAHKVTEARQEDLQRHIDKVSGRPPWKLQAKGHRCF